MTDLAPTPVQLGPWRPRLAAWSGLGLVIEALEHNGGLPTPVNYVDDVLLREPQREPFLALIDHTGLVVCKQVGADHPTHREVRGRSSRGRLSQGEYYHHDGCSGPVKPRVVEIRCPHQATPRHIATAIAPFPASVHAMLHELPAALVTAELAPGTPSPSPAAKSCWPTATWSRACSIARSAATSTPSRPAPTSAPSTCAPAPTASRGASARAASSPTATPYARCSTAAPISTFTAAANKTATCSSAGPPRRPEEA